MPQKPSCNIFNIFCLGTAFIALSLLFKLFILNSDPLTSIRVVNGPQGQPSDLTLRFQKDGTFRIAVFEDLHFGEGMFTILHDVYLVLTLLQRKTQLGARLRM